MRGFKNVYNRFLNIFLLYLRYQHVLYDDLNTEVGLFFFLFELIYSFRNVKVFLICKAAHLPEVISFIPDILLMMCNFISRHSAVFQLYIIRVEMKILGCPSQLPILNQTFLLKIITSDVSSSSLTLLIFLIFFNCINSLSSYSFTVLKH